MENSRTERSFRNISTGLILRMVTLLLSFLSRTFFIRLLGDGCLGLNGLFTTILQMFSLADLGIGQAITYYMFKPIAEEDEDRLIVLVRFYRNCYRVIGFALGAIGLILVPFLPSIVNLEVDTGYNVTLVYLLYLANTVVSYLFFSYPRTVLSAHQEEFIINKVESLFVFASTLCEILSLLITKNFIVYLVVKLAVLITKNIVMGVISIKKHPYIRKKTASRFEKGEILTMFRDVYALFIVKLSSQLFNSTDNIFISAMLSTVIAGYNSNYMMIINAVYGIVSTVISSCNASVGNLCATVEKPQAEKVFRTMDFINFWISCFCGVCLYRLLNPFISLVWGEKYIFSIIAVALMALNFYTVSSLYTLFGFRQGLGLFRYCIYNQLFAAIINIVLDFALGKLWGIEGLFMATLIANLFFCIFPYAKNLYQVGFEAPAKGYVFRIVRGLAVFLLACMLTDFACIPMGGGVGGFILQILVCLLVPNLLICLLFMRSEEFKSALGYIQSMAEKILGKVKKNAL